MHRILELEDAAVATSGNYRNFFTEDGRRYSHLIDPRTARPVYHDLTSVTVIDQSAMTADALSTALMVMGSDEGYAFAETSGVAAFFIVKAGDRLVNLYTSACASWLA